MESWIHAFTSGESLFTHLKEIDKWRINSEQNIRLVGGREGRREGGREGGGREGGREREGGQEGRKERKGGGGGRVGETERGTERGGEEVSERKRTLYMCTCKN